MFKVCIIGCGMIAIAGHIPAYKQFPEDYEIVAVCDVNEQVAEETARKYQIPNCFADVKEMLVKCRPDVVSVCVPNYWHMECTILALRYGANVICEEPLALKRNDASIMFSYAQKRGKVLMACQSMRFTPEKLAAKKYIEEYGLDDIYYGELVSVCRPDISTGLGCHITGVNGGGELLNVGVHMLDTMVWLMGNSEVKSVYAVAIENYKQELHNQRRYQSGEMDVENFVCGIISFDNKAKINFKIACAENMLETSNISLIGNRVGIHLPKGLIFSNEKCNKTLAIDPLLYDAAYPGHIYIVDNIRKVLKGKAEPIVKPDETINVSTILELFYKSTELGRQVFRGEIL